MIGLRFLQGAMIACSLLVLSNCGGSDPGTSPLAAKQASEEAIMRGEPAASQPDDPSAATCKRSGGDWITDQQHCAVTRALCEGSAAGTWQADAGCIVAIDSEAECSGFSGIQWSQGRCVIAYLNGQELAQNGF